MRNTTQRHYLSTFLLSIIFVTAACIDEAQIVRNCSATESSLYNPVILTHPASDTIHEGNTVTLSVVATAPRETTLTYQWQKTASGSTHFTDIADATADSYTTPILSHADSGTQYRVVVTATHTAKRMMNSTMSNDATLSVLTSAIIVWTDINGTRRYAYAPTDGILLSATLTDTATDIQSVDTIPSSVTTIGDYAFNNCTALTSIRTAGSITTIGAYAFNDCAALTSISTLNNVTTIGDYAFNNCKALMHVGPLTSVITIGDFAFTTCKALTSIRSLTSVATIGKYAFSGCKALTSISSLSRVTRIGNDAFSGCIALTDVGTLASVHTIGGYAFWNCSSLANISMPNGIISIEQAAFQGCSSLTHISIPNSIISIGQRAFRLCTSLASVRVEAARPPSGVDNMFDSTHATLRITVPSTSVYTYKHTAGWSAYASKITAY